jgi:predicted nuclease of predicted toxin-antitoxin system
LDEHVPHAIAHGLRRRQIDVTTTTDAGLIGASDEDHMALALREQRVFFTNDRDFLRLAARGTPHAGIVYCRPEDSRIGDVIRYLALMDECLSAERLPTTSSIFRCPAEENECEVRNACLSSFS